MHASFASVLFEVLVGWRWISYTELGKQTFQIVISNVFNEYFFFLARARVVRLVGVVNSAKGDGRGSNFAKNRKHFYPKVQLRF